MVSNAQPTPNEPGKSLLVVDDERFFRERIGEVLLGAGLPHVVASTGEEALQLGRDPAIGGVILDIELPDISGLEVLRKLREERPDVRVIVLSAHTQQELVLDALRLGACDYLAKPIHEEELLLAAGRALESHGWVRDYRRLEARLSDLANLCRSLSAVAREEDQAARQQEIAAAAVRGAAQIVGASKSSLMRMDDLGERLRVVAVHGRKRDPDRMDSVALGEEVAGRVAASGEAVLVEDTDQDPRYRGRGTNQRYDSRSFIVVPLLGLGSRPGALCVTDPEGGGPLGLDELALLRVLACQVGELLAREEVPDILGGELFATDDAEAEDVDAANQLSFPELREGEAFDAPMSDEAELARVICDVVTADVDPKRFLPEALTRIATALGAEPVSLYLPNRESEEGELALEAQCAVGTLADRPRLPAGRGLTGSVLASGQLMACADPAADPRFDPGVDTPAGGEARPLLCGPLRFRDAILGVYRVFPEDPRQCRARMGELLSAVLGAALRNALLYRSLVETIEESAKSPRTGSSPDAPGAEA